MREPIEVKLPRGEKPLVLSTVHTHDAAGAVTRLRDMGVEPFLLASTLRTVLAQRLVRRLCDACREPYAADAATAHRLNVAEGQTLFRARGCEHCRGTGYQGRSAIHELLVVDETLRSAILQGHDAGALQALAVQGGMLTLYDDGLRKVAAGVTSLDELLRVTQDQSEA